MSLSPIRHLKNLWQIDETGTTPFLKLKPNHTRQEQNLLQTFLPLQVQDFNVGSMSAIWHKPFVLDKHGHILLSDWDANTLDECAAISVTDLFKLCLLVPMNFGLTKMAGLILEIKTVKQWHYLQELIGLLADTPKQDEYYRQIFLDQEKWVIGQRVCLLNERFAGADAVKVQTLMANKQFMNCQAVTELLKMWEQRKEKPTITNYPTCSNPTKVFQLGSKMPPAISEYNQTHEFEPIVALSPLVSLSQVFTCLQNGQQVWFLKQGSKDWQRLDENTPLNITTVQFKDYVFAKPIQMTSKTVRVVQSVGGLPRMGDSVFVLQPQLQMALLKLSGLNDEKMQAQLKACVKQEMWSGSSLQLALLQNGLIFDSEIAAFCQLHNLFNSLYQGAKSHKGQSPLLVAVLTQLDSIIAALADDSFNLGVNQ